jgi:hypothetical protein
MPPPRRIEVVHNMPSPFTNGPSPRGLAGRLIEVRISGAPSVVRLPLAELQAALRSLATAAASSLSAAVSTPRAVAGGQLYLALLPKSTSPASSLSSTSGFLAVGPVSPPETSVDDGLGLSGGNGDSLVSSLSEDEWQLATRGGRPLGKWSAGDVAHWLKSFAPLAR